MILNGGCHLTKNARKKLARMIREYIPLNIKSRNIKSKSIEINITQSSSKLPFVEAIFRDPNSSQLNQEKTYNTMRMLIGTGSDCSLIPYNTFKSMGFQCRNMMQPTIYNSKGSTGMCKIVIFGKVFNADINKE